jgi:tetratricopeptide (TPR) repeat protein
MDRLTQLQALLAADPGNQLLSIDLFDGFITEGRYDEGLALADTLDASLRVNPAIRLRVARCALSTSRAAFAIDELTAAMVAGDTSPVVRHDLAFALFCTGQREQAEEVLAPVVVFSDEIPEIGLLHARLLFHRGDLDAAGLVADVVTSSHPQRADAWGLAALIHLDRNVYDVAAHAASRALAMDPRQQDALLAKGGIALTQGDAPTALSCFDAVASHSAANGRAMGGAGEAHLLAGDHKAARPLLEHATLLQPGHLGTWHALAWTQLLAGDVTLAAASFRMALDVDRNFGESHGGMAIVYALEGKAELADQAIRRARRLDPEGNNARYAESLLLEAAGQSTEADAILRLTVARQAKGARLPAGDLVARLRTLMAGPGHD